MFSRMVPNPLAKDIVSTLHHLTSQQMKYKAVTKMYPSSPALLPWVGVEGWMGCVKESVNSPSATNPLLFKQIMEDNLITESEHNKAVEMLSEILEGTKKSTVNKSISDTSEKYYELTSTSKMHEVTPSQMGKV